VATSFYYLINGSVLIETMKIAQGAKFITTGDISTKAMTHWKASFTDGVDCTIPKGTILITSSDSLILQSGFTCVPERKKELELILIPEETRFAPEYTGYSFGLKKSEIGKRLQKID
jgi:hypothetical protein